jgi:hypothetical protein
MHNSPSSSSRCINIHTTHYIEVLKGCVRYPLSSSVGIWNSHVGTLPLHTCLLAHSTLLGDSSGRYLPPLPNSHVCRARLHRTRELNLIILYTNLTVRLKPLDTQLAHCTLSYRCLAPPLPAATGIGGGGGGGGGGGKVGGCGGGGGGGDDNGGSG